MKSFMKSKVARFLFVALLAIFISAALAADPAFAQKKKGKGKKKKADAAAQQTEITPAEAQPTAAPATPVSQPATATPVTETAPVSDPAPKQATSAPSMAAPTAMAKEVARPARSVWGVEVAPHGVLGSGRPGKSAADFDKPDGVAFLKNGWLLATDAKNRRIQIWDVKTNTHLGEFGHGVFGGEVVDIAVTPDDKVFVTDQVLNLAYLFEAPKPGELSEKGKPLGPYDFQFKGTRFGEQGFEKLGGIAVDPQGRVYLVDAHLNEVKRFTPDFKVDPSFTFERARPDGTTYLHGCEGIAFDEARGNLYIASEKDSVVQVFDLQTGAYKKRLVGKLMGADGQPGGTSVFSGAIEGLTIVNGHLLAVDESVGQIQMFDLARADIFNADLPAYTARPRRAVAYRGFFGHPPMVNFEDKANLALQQKVKDGAIIPGQANPPGYFCSPDAIASHTDATGETYVAIADQCNYRIAVYRWSDISRAIGAGNSRTVAGLSPVEKAAGAVPVTNAGGNGGKKKKGKKQ